MSPGLELLGRSRSNSATAALHLPFGERVHDFDSAQNDAHTAKTLDAQYRLHESFDFGLAPCRSIVRSKKRRAATLSRLPRNR